MKIAVFTHPAKRDTDPEPDEWVKQHNKPALVLHTDVFEVAIGRLRKAQEAGETTGVLFVSNKMHALVCMRDLKITMPTLFKNQDGLLHCHMYGEALTKMIEKRGIPFGEWPEEEPKKSEAAESDKA